MKRRINHRKRADELFSKYVKQRDQRCLAEGHKFDCGGPLQCAHVISRSYGVIRWNPDNATTLCRNHHVYFTHKPLEWSEWVEATFPGRWDVLRRRALSGDKPDAKGAVAALTMLLADLVA